MDRSDQINELAEALCLAQGDFPNVPKDANNPFFKSKYADLTSIIDTVRPVLKKHGLSFTQLPTMDSTIPSVTTLLIHKSGQFISSVLPMPAAKVDAQGIGSAITYARRYGLQAILGLAAEDDDGNAATGQGTATDKKTQRQEKTEPAKESVQKSNDDEVVLKITKVDEPITDRKKNPMLTMLVSPINGKDLAFCWNTKLFDRLKQLEGTEVKAIGIWMAKGFCINKIVDEPF